MALRIEVFIVGDFSTNCYYLKTPAGGVLIDPGSWAEKFIERVKSLDYKFILLTHAHIDHIKGLKFLKEKPIYLFKEEEEIIRNSQYNLSFMLGEDFFIDKGYHLLDEGKVNIEGIIFKVIHTPGHTPGSCCFLFEDNLFSGDTLFCQGIGRTDLPYSSYTDIIRSIKEKLFVLPPQTKVLPGHGPSTTIIQEKEENPFLSDG